ncbi:protein kinase-like protein [Saccharopolyspora erythraea NRRL 2338]|uniref:Serine/threonine protein kinase n=3 Tax=Saccharopolyspora erythraea TaxID=1836 RepID=A4FHH4_SACEN|nr:class III lanthionine synthetase LanKC [Saccharopolyspora erythraea]PFG97192.1 protein kinase-like protein [Saccharopolyspora erythraea NRRL 2338]QRK87393.1 class III lanthionine synthetase LanKC [Saccharopolyspora erythraea]CAM03499.1 serine/threonine protein kinase [Saccharopolyspora erythraea NRRL 2338]
MDLRYEAFCFADPLFFDEQRRHSGTQDEYARQLPEPGDDWVRSALGTWHMLRPAEVVLPAQGWKVHVSATLGNAERVLAAVHRYCLRERVAFKHLRSPRVLLARNAKYAPRSASGKLVTIYPVDDEHLATVLTELAPQLRGEPGPYILSDLRYEQGPLYVRYGGFAERWVEFDGTRVLAIAGPDGELVPDKRNPGFSLPDWVSPPECLSASLAARKGGDRAAFGYRVTSSMHFSNGGGVYRAVRKSDGAEVVLKEARPHAGLDRDGTDAVARLHREHEVLRRLDGIGGVPAVHELFQLWEHTFLAMDLVPGTPLGTWLARTYPLTRQHPTEQEIADYTRRALALLERVERLLDRVHGRGVVFGDLHGLNVLVDEDDEVSVIDFEMASTDSAAPRPALGAPGFRAPEGRTGVAIDRYALAALKLWMFLPLNPLLELSPGKLAGFVDIVERRFPLPAGFGDQIRRELLGTEAAVTELDNAVPDWGVVRKGLAEAILCTATPEREDRLFPGDIEQFRVGGTCFAYGAAGVLHALDAAGLGRYPEHERWLVDAVRRTAPARPGFLDGAHGIAHVLENLGHHSDADALLDGAATLVEQTRDHGFGGGLSGIALNLLHFASTRDDRELRERARDLGDRLADALRVALPPGSVGRAGLLDGWAGPALLFTHLHDDTGDRGWLELADRALQRDLDECVATDDGALQVRDSGTRTLPYLAVGSAGVALVAEELAARHPGASCLERQPELLRGCLGEFVIHPGLLFGRCGLLAALAAANRRAPDPMWTDAVSRHLTALGWHAIPHGDGGIAMPGNQLLRLSMDLATGGAGVLSAVAATLDGHGRVLPFFGRPNA